MRFPSATVPDCTLLLDVLDSNNRSGHDRVFPNSLLAHTEGKIRVALGWFKRLNLIDDPLRILGVIDEREDVLRPP
jgi:hypothetical protein